MEPCALLMQRENGVTTVKNYLVGGSSKELNIK
jgi:hypothetical protein